MWKIDAARKRREFDPNKAPDLDGLAAPIKGVEHAAMQAEDLDMPHVDNDLPAIPIVTTSLGGFALPAEEHREKHADATSAAFAAMVAKSIPIREAN